MASTARPMGALKRILVIQRLNFILRGGNDSHAFWCGDTIYKAIGTRCLLFFSLVTAFDTEFLCSPVLHISLLNGV